jgi:hypothetical protein
MIEAIDLTTNTPSPIRLSTSEYPEDKPAFSHDVPVPAGSPVLSEHGTSGDNTGSSVLDLAYSNYQDFDVLLDSTLCLPSPRNFVQLRPPTPPAPPRKRKKVTFATSPEDVIGERSKNQQAFASVLAPTNTNKSDESEYMESSPEPVQAYGSPTQARDFPQLGRPRKVEPRLVLPSPNFASRNGMIAEPLPLFPSFTPRYKRSHLTEESLSSPAASTLRHRTRDASSSPSAGAESTARGSYLIPIMTVRINVNSKQLTCLRRPYPGAR